MNEGSKFDSAMMALVAIVVVCLVFGTISSLLEQLPQTTPSVQRQR